MTEGLDHGLQDPQWGCWAGPCPGEAGGSCTEWLRKSDWKKEERKREENVYHSAAWGSFALPIVEMVSGEEKLLELWQCQPLSVQG
jgi:hypothetical protein